MTPMQHWLRTAAMVSMSVQIPIKVLVESVIIYNTDS
jgi:hypothetical protein